MYANQLDQVGEEGDVVKPAAVGQVTLEHGVDFGTIQQRTGLPQSGFTGANHLRVRFVQVQKKTSHRSVDLMEIYHKNISKNLVFEVF